MGPAFLVCARSSRRIAPPGIDSERTAARPPRCQLAAGLAEADTRADDADAVVARMISSVGGGVRGVVIAGIAALAFVRNLSHGYWMPVTGKSLAVGDGFTRCGGRISAHGGPLWVLSAAQ
jgi:hypothetical protein